MTTAILAGLALGAAGSVHCLAMCGPLVALVHARRPAAAPRGGSAGWTLQYHAGRTAVYAGLGAAAGWTGAAISSAGLGRPLAVAAAVVLLIQAAVLAGLLRRGAALGVTQRLTAALPRLLAWLRARGLAGPVAMGALNGLLPCGLVYAALAVAAGLGRVPDAVLLMTAFGLGTTPALALVGFSSRTMSPRLPSAARRLIPAMLAVVALLLLARGLRTLPAGMVHASGAATAPPAHSHVR